MVTSHHKIKEFQEFLNSENVKNGHAIIRAIAGLTRYRIIQLLLANPAGLTVSTITEILSASPSKISHQLRILKNYDLVFVKRSKQTMTYQLNTKKTMPFLL